MAQYFKAMAVFANNAGGYLLFGVGDKPRRLLGLKDKRLIQFEELKVEEFNKVLLDYFSPEITMDHCTFEFRDMSFGVIYVYPLTRKPCIYKCPACPVAHHPSTDHIDFLIFKPGQHGKSTVQFELMISVYQYIGRSVRSSQQDDRTWIVFI